MAKWLIYTLFALTVVAGIKFFSGNDGMINHISEISESVEPLNETAYCVLHVPGHYADRGVCKSQACTFRLGAVESAVNYYPIPVTLQRFQNASLYAIFKYLALLRVVCFMRWQKQGIHRVCYQRHDVMYYVFALRRMLI